MSQKKTHCVRGHEIAIVGRTGNGTCRACQREAAKDYARRYRDRPHVCGAKGCDRPAAQSASGKYHTHCQECRSEINARAVSVRVGYGMRIYIGLAPTPEIREAIGKATRKHYAQRGAA